MQHIYTIRPLVLWRPHSAQHHESRHFAVMVMALLPRFQSSQPTLLESIQVVCKRPANVDGILSFLKHGFPLSHQVS